MRPGADGQVIEEPTITRTKNKRHKRRDEPIEPPGSIRWRGTLACLGVAVFLAGFSVPLADTLVSQIRSMVPAWTPPLPPEAPAILRRALQTRPEIPSVGQALARVAGSTTGDRDLSPFRQLDSDNGLYLYLDRLARLPEPGESDEGDPRTSEKEIRSLLRDLRGAPQARLHLSSYRALVETALRDASVSSRRSAVEAMRIGEGVKVLGERHRPVIRRLVQRLLAQGDAWREAGKIDEARLAYAAVVRLLTDLVDDSPLPEVALLATEGLPTALRGLDAEEEARKVKAFRNRWHESARADQTNLLPWMGDFTLARAAHDRTLRSLTVSVAAVGAWLVLAGISFVQLVIIAVTRPGSAVRIRWRWAGRGMWAAVGVALVPLVAFCLLVAVADVPFVWLFSYPSLPAFLLLFTLVPAAAGLATRLCVRPADEMMKSLVPTRAAWGLLAVLLLTVVVGLAAWPVKTAGWRPPVGIQWFRQLGWVIGLECIVGTAVWVGWGVVRRRRAGLRAGVWARANLSVAAASLLAAAVVSLAVMGVNTWQNSRHREAFVEAARDPVTDRLGANWWEDHFAPAQSAIRLSGSTSP